MIACRLGAMVAASSLGDGIRTNMFGLDMREHFVIDPLIGKRQQLMLATQLCRMVLKVCYAALCTFRKVAHGAYRSIM